MRHRSRKPILPLDILHAIRLYEFCFVLIFCIFFKIDHHSRSIATRDSTTTLNYTNTHDTHFEKKMHETNQMDCLHHYNSDPIRYNGFNTICVMQNIFEWLEFICHKSDFIAFKMIWKRCLHWLFACMQ